MRLTVPLRWQSTFGKAPLTLLLLLLLLGLVGFAAGCQSPQAGGAHLATVHIPGQTPEAIRQATRKVFEEHGYTGEWGVMSMVFHRPGSTMQNIAYGDWDLSSVSVRVEVTIAESSFGGHQLSCDAALVRNAGDSVFEDSHKVRKISKGPYQKMLKEVRDRLAKPPAPGASRSISARAKGG